MQVRGLDRLVWTVALKDWDRLGQVPCLRHPYAHCICLP